MDPMTTSEDHHRHRLKLAEKVRHRRLELGLSIRQAAEAGDVARGTWTALEEGARRTADNNFAGIERALQWKAGSIASTLQGGEPTPVRSPTVARRAVKVSPAQSSDEAALAKVMRSHLDDATKRRIVNLLIAEKEEYDRRIGEQADRMIRLFGDE